MTDQLSADLAALRISRDESPRPPSRLPRVIAVMGLLGAVSGGVAVVLPHVQALVFKTEVMLTEVTMVSPVQASVSVTSTGYVVAQTVSKVGAKVGGRIAKVHVREGSVVRVGDPLIELDDADQKLAIAAAASRVAVARARADAARAALAETRQQTDREKGLVERGVAGRALLEDLTARGRSLQESAKAADAEAVSAAAEVATLRALLRDRTIAAPIDGTVVNKPPEAGEIIGPGMPATVEIADLASVVVETDVPEARLSMIKPGSPCEIVLDAYPSKRRRGETFEIGKKVNRAKATVTVRVRFVDAIDDVLPDMSARTSFLTEALSAEAMKEPPKRVIPTAAVVERAGARVVFVVEDGAVRSVPVTVGGPFGGGLELLEGPAAGSRVVAHPPPKLTAGQRVKEKGS